MAGKTPLTPGWACYVRLSDEDKQRPELSLPAQRRNIETSLLATSDLSVFRWYEDRLSGRLSDRPDYQQLLADARAGHFSHLGLSRADRFGRDIVEALSAVTELLGLGITIKTADMPNLDITTPDGFFVTVIQMGLAHRESHVISERVKSRMQEKLLGGDWPWKAPDGYLNCEEKLPGGGKYRRWIEPDPDRFHLVQEIRRQFATGEYTLAGMCERLHQRGYLRRNGRSWVKDGRPAIQAVHRILTNEFYAGWLVSETWGLRAAGNHTPTDDEQLHARILAVLREHDKGKVRQRKYEYLLPGILWSQEANTRLYVTHVRGRHGGLYGYYYTRKRVGSSCIYILCRKVDEQMPRFLSEIAIDQTIVVELHALCSKHVSDIIDQHRDKQEAILKRQISQLRDEELRLGRLLVVGTISERAHSQLQSEWRGKLIAAKARLAQVRRDKASHVLDLDRATWLLANASRLYSEPHLSLKDKKRLIETIVRRITVNQAGEIVSTDLHPPFPYLRQLSHQVQQPSAQVASTSELLNPADLTPLTFPTQHILLRSPALFEPVEAAVAMLRA